MNELPLIKFIRENKDWEVLLTNEPFWLKIGKSEKYPHLSILNYRQWKSDFSNPIVQNARGIILNDRLEVVCHAFNKFGNHGEAYVKEIDWNTSVVLEKIDGSLMKVWFDKVSEQWILSSNQVIDCSRTLAAQFLDAADVRTMNEFSEKHELCRDKVYIFELVGPSNRVVIDYPSNDIIQIGCRNMITLEEETPNLEGIAKPKQHNFSSLKEAVNFAKDLPVTREGFVVVDGEWNRLKVKGRLFVAAHHNNYKDGGVLSKKDALRIIMMNEQEEFTISFPEHKHMLTRLHTNYQNLLKRISEDLDKVDVAVKQGLEGREVFNCVKNSGFPNIKICMDYRDKKFERYLLNEYLLKVVSIKKLLAILDNNK